MNRPEELQTLTIIIPTLNEAASLRAMLDAVRQVRGLVELLVVDGGSNDATEEVARECGVRVLSAERGRGAQMHAGACRARGGVLWFLHADTLPPPDAAEKILEALQDRAVVGGNFHLRFDGRGRASRFLTWLYPQLRKLGLAYGDSGIFVRACIYREIGGFESFPLFEDLDLVRRLRRRGRMVHLTAAVVTSSRRFEGRSFTLTFARWAILQGLYWLGVHPRTLVRLYAPVRRARARD